MSVSTLNLDGPYADVFIWSFLGFPSLKRGALGLPNQGLEVVEESHKERLVLGDRKYSLSPIVNQAMAQGCTDCCLLPIPWYMESHGFPFLNPPNHESRDPPAISLVVKNMLILSQIWGHGDNFTYDIFQGSLTMTMGNCGWMAELECLYANTGVLSVQLLLNW